MSKYKVITLTLLAGCLLVALCFVPMKSVFLFTETRTDKPDHYYIPMNKTDEFQIRYVHSIHLTDVIESYSATPDDKIRLLSMTYESLAIGLPGYASEGETFTFNNGVYTLTYNDKILDSFTMLIGNVDADLAFHYNEKEIDLKERLTKGKSYRFSVSKLSIYEMVKEVNIYGER
ncbi:DUF1850 domain-containing protein [Sporosarcina sp. CAU 1771]